MMEVTQLQLPPLHPAQVEIASCPARYRVVVTGRQSGKSVLAGQELWVRLINQQAAQWVIAPDYERTSYILKSLLMFNEKTPVVKFYKRDGIFAYKQGYIKVRSADDPQSLRGDTLDFLVFDEAAFIKKEAWEMAAEPMLAVKQGGALFLSTAFGRNWFYDLWMYAKHSGDPEWAAFKFPSTANPFFPQSEYDAKKRRLPPLVFLQEYEAEFVEENAQVFQNVDGAATLLPALAPERHQVYVAGLDWGNAQDKSVLHIMNTSVKPIRSVAKYSFNEIGWGAQREWLVKLIQHWNIRLVLAELNAMGSPNVEALQAEGMPIVGFQTQTESKRVIIDSLRLAIADNLVQTLNDKDLKDQLKAFEMEQLPSGRYRYGAPPGMHDDEVIAMALCWHAAGGEYMVGNKIRRVKASGLYERDVKRTYPSWQKKVNVVLPR